VRLSKIRELVQRSARRFNWEMPEQLEDLYENALGFEASIQLPAVFRSKIPSGLGDKIYSVWC
jgi:hypothetical protein